MASVISTAAFSLVTCTQIEESPINKRKTSPVSEEEHALEATIEEEQRKAIKASTPKRRKSRLQMETPNQSILQAYERRSSIIHIEAPVVPSDEFTCSFYSIEDNLRQCMSELKGLEEFTDLSKDFEQAFSALY